jgi:O-antigen/teichoic acid export membrane protein
VGAVFLVFYNFINIAQFVFLSLYRAKIVFWITLCLKGGFIISSLAMFWWGRGLPEIVALFALSSLVISAGIFIRLKSLYSPAPESVRYLKYMKFGFNAWLIKFLNYFLGRYFDIFILGLWGVAKTEISYFNIALSITLALSYFFTSGFSGISMAFFSEHAEDKSQLSRLVQGWLVVTKFALFFCIPAFIFVIFNARQMIVGIYSDSFASSAPLLQIFASFFLLTMVLGSGINSTVLFAMQKDHLVLKWRALWGLVNVVLDILFVQLWQTTGVVVATGISTLGIIACEYGSLRALIKFKYPALFLVKISIATAFSTLVNWFISTPGWIGLFFKGLLFTLAFFVVLWFIKPFSKQDRELVGRFLPALERFVKPFEFDA